MAEAVSVDVQRQLQRAIARISSHVCGIGTGLPAKERRGVASGPLPELYVLISNCCKIAILLIDRCNLGFEPKSPGCENEATFSPVAMRVALNRVWRLR